MVFNRTGLVVAALLGSVASGVLASPASALERLVLRLPFLETSITINLSDDQSAEELIRSSPDLKDLQEASGGELLGVLEQVFLAPLPVETKALLEGSTGQPLLEQALFAAASLVELEGVEVDPSGRMLTDALIRAEQAGQANVLGFLKQMPGEQASVDLSRVATIANRLKFNMEEGVALAKKGEAEASNPNLFQLRDRGWIRSEQMVSVNHRPDPLRVLVLQPKVDSNRRLAVISHGLWDDPESFEGWAEFLAAAGYTVLLPDHPGSDFQQQKAMLAGDRPPPGPEELRLRPLDISALLDAVQNQSLLGGRGLITDDVAVIGHSWGATTSLQMAGGTPVDRKLKSRCADVMDSERNISWVLQCSWLSGIDQAGISDARVKAVVAISPPLRLLFAPESADGLSAKILLVSGTRDWVVPSRPEAILPMRTSGASRFGHRLVLVEGADHFTLRSFAGEQQPAVVGPMLLAWLNDQLGVQGAVGFSTGGWGDDRLRLVDVTGQL